MPAPSQILKLVQRGYSHAAIAARLHCSEMHVRRAVEKYRQAPEPTTKPCPDCGAIIHRYCASCNLSKSAGPEIEKTPEPTKHLPGSASKLDVLRQRVERGESLFHEDDNDDYEGCVGGVKGATGHPQSGMGRRSYEETKVVFEKAGYRE